jgi:DNA-binding transcriptional ArsR family regulator
VRGLRSGGALVVSALAEASVVHALHVDGGADIAAVARLLGDPTRSRILDALLDGRAHAAGELARRAEVAPSTASEHLAALLAHGLVGVESRGRRRYYELASPLVADALEALGRIAAPTRVRSLRSANRAEAFRTARTCYDHLAGRVGVGVTEALVRRRALVPGDGAFELTSRGERLLEGLGVDVAAARGHRRAFARACVDLTERRPHLAGALGAGVASALLEHDWLRRRPHDRALLVTPAGRERLQAELGLELA